MIKMKVAHNLNEKMKRKKVIKNTKSSIVVPAAIGVNKRGRRDLTNKTPIICSLCSLYTGILLLPLSAIYYNIYC